MIKALFRWQTLALLIWIFLLANGLRVLWAYENIPSPQLTKATRMHHGQIQLDPSRPTVVMFAHPQCPCTKASLLELQELEHSLRGFLKMQIFFIQPASKNTEWVKSPLWELAQSIPGAEVSIDHLGVLAKSLNAQISGETLLYSPSGDLLFSGGITPSRGHTGRNFGITAIGELTTQGRTKYARTNVYGCSLFNNDGQGSSTWK
ncbi:hypothetical protein [Bdellovibrio sp. HCB337]|uniref:hypothetical protein n=1 Tax=Bdellovibrio sp. HCB337 TaxID=3394358 RepID=UPI0039A4CA94